VAKRLVKEREVLRVALQTPVEIRTILRRRDLPTKQAWFYWDLRTVLLIRGIQCTQMDAMSAYLRTANRIHDPCYVTGFRDCGPRLAG